MRPRSRRRVLQSGVGVGLAGVAGCVSLFGDDEAAQTGRTRHETDVSLSGTGTWPTYRHDAANTGGDPDTSGPTHDAEVAWRYSAHTEAESGVAVAGSRAYAGGLVVDGEAGRRRGGDWRGHTSTPTVADGTLYVGAHDLEARDPATAEPQWTFETDRDVGGLPAPTVASGTVYVPGGLRDPTLYAVDADGAERWRVETDAEVNVPVAVVDETVYAVDDESTVYAVGTDGEVRWRRTLGADVSRSAPVVVDDRVYLGSWDGSALALETGDGATDWRQDGDPVGFRVGGPVAVTAETVFAAGREGQMAALEAATGRERWTVATGAYELGAPAVANGVVYVGAATGGGAATLFALDAGTGEERWRVETREVDFGDYARAGVNGSPAVVDGVVYVATAPGDLYAIHER